RLAAKEGGIEENQIEAFGLHRSEQVPLSRLATVHQVMDPEVDLRAAHRLGIDVHGHDAPRPSTGEDGSDPRPGAQVENARFGSDWLGVESPDQELAGPEELRIEDPGQDQDRRSEDRLQDEPIVASALK